MDNLGEGLSSLGFWIFLAVLVYCAMKAELHKKEQKLEVLKTMIASGQMPEQAQIDALLKGDCRGGVWQLTLCAIVFLSLAVGMALVAIGALVLKGSAIYPLWVLSPLLLCLSIGLFVAARITHTKAGK